MLSLESTWSLHSQMISSGQVCSKAHKIPISFKQPQCIFFSSLQAIISCFRSISSTPSFLRALKSFIILLQKKPYRFYGIVFGAVLLQRLIYGNPTKALFLLRFEQTLVQQQKGIIAGFFASRLHFDFPADLAQGVITLDFVYTMCLRKPRGKLFQKRVTLDHQLLSQTWYPWSIYLYSFPVSD